MVNSARPSVGPLVISSRRSTLDSRLELNRETLDLGVYTGGGAITDVGNPLVLDVLADDSMNLESERQCPIESGCARKAERGK